LSLDVPSGFGRECLDEDSAVGERPRVQVHQLGNTLGNPIRHARDHKPAVAVPQKHGVVKILELD
jgi:hypothetical protein